MRSRLDLIGRSGQDELLSIRNDLMTVYREISADDDRLFPLRYARALPRRPDSARGRGAPSEGTGAGAGGPPPGTGAVGAAPVPVTVGRGRPGRAARPPFCPLRRRLAARGLDALMMEHRGVGLSRLAAEGHDLPREAMRVREVIADLVAVLDHARVDRVAVYGSDYGAYLAQALAALHPERVHSLVRSEEHTSELQSRGHLVCRLLLDR